MRIIPSRQTFKKTPLFSIGWLRINTACGGAKDDLKERPMQEAGVQCLYVDGEHPSTNVMSACDSDAIASKPRFDTRGMYHNVQTGNYDVNNPGLNMKRVRITAISCRHCN